MRGPNKGQRAACALGSAQRALCSAETDGLEIRISLDDLAQPIFGRTIAAVGVGMMALHQRLELPLDLLCRGIRVEAERIERLALGIAHGTGFRHAPLRAPPPAAPSAEFPE